jgi:SAM-dependent methyltransferase
MSWIGEALLRSLVRWRGSGAAVGEQTASSWDSYVRWQFESSARLFSRYPDFDPAGKSVLEIGCGTGGRSAYLATQAARVVGIDINREEIEIARKQCAELYPQTRERLTFHASSENDLLPLGEFDLVLLVDAMEHVVSPPSMLRLAYRYTRPGGWFYFSTMGWYHHSGSHTGLLPFVNLFFSDETILNVVRWRVSQPDYRPGRFDSDPPVERWRGLYNLRDRPGEHLNKITIAEVKKLVRHSIFAENQMTILGFSRPRALAALVNPLRHVPLLQEVFHSYVVVKCRK